MKKLIAGLMISILLAACSSNATKDDQDGPSNTILAVMEIENYGEVTIELYEDIAPETVANFVKLAESGFYDGLTFHRIIDGFMVQGGDPSGNGTGGSGETIKGEFSSNGFENDLKHEDGVISMARAKNPDSASSQFFIMVNSAPHLDGNYAAFGKVTEGLEYIHQMAKDANPIDDNGTILPEEQPVIIYIRIKK
jgi:peptidyl-prolyl cis-trans isomerase B (cyclophilin B)